jgi:acylphosphatase
VRRFLAIIILCFLGADAAFALELQSILERVMVTPPARVGFRELRSNEMFAESLELTGFLEYLEDGEMRKVVETPFEEAFRVRSDRVELERNGETRVLPISKSRGLRTMLGGIEAILAGKTEQLEKLFRYELTGEDSAWSLQLTPKSRRAAKQLQSLTVTGDMEVVTSIRIDLAGGEHHLMEIRREAAAQ